MARPDPMSIAEALGPPEDEKSEDSGDGDMESAASDLLAAIEKKDPKAVAEALKAAVAMC